MNQAADLPWLRWVRRNRVCLADCESSPDGPIPRADAGMSAIAHIVPLARLGRPGGQMGFWGTFIVARADQPLPELPALRQSAESVVWHGRGLGGWQAVQMHRGP